MRLNESSERRYIPASISVLANCPAFPNVLSQASAKAILRPAAAAETKAMHPENEVIWVH